MAWEGWLERKVDWQFDLFEARDIDLEQYTSGAYIMRAISREKPFLYPGGWSKVVLSELSFQ